MAFSAEVKIETSIDLEDIKQRLEGEALEVFERGAKSMLDATRTQWRGWRYKDRDLSKTGASQAGWQYTQQATEGARTITFTNSARSPTNKKGGGGGKPYAQYVKRRKGATEEWRLVLDMLVEEELPKLIEALVIALKDASSTRGSYKKVRANHATTATTLIIDI